MKLISQFTFSALLLSILVLLAPVVQASDTIIDTPGAHIQSGGSGTLIVTPGTQIQTPHPPAPTYYVPSPTANVVASPSSASYVNAQLPGMDFSNQNLAGANFTNADLSGAHFNGANLAGTNFVNAILRGADFTNANLVGANLTNANLSNADLSNADLSHANLTNATIDHTLAINTNFANAILVNVNMGLLIRQPAARPAFVDARAISNALRIDPAHPSIPRKIDLTVNFDFNSDRLTTDGAKQVREIAAALSDAGLQSSHILVEGHTDNVGSDVYNENLSYRRALRVLQSLTNDYHVSPALLSAKGFGKTRPIASNDNDLGRAMNRRVTLVNLGN